MIIAEKPEKNQGFNGIRTRDLRGLRRAFEHVRDETSIYVVSNYQSREV